MERSSQGHQRLTALYLDSWCSVPCFSGLDVRLNRFPTGRRFIFTLFRSLHRFFGGTPLRASARWFAETAHKTAARPTGHAAACLTRTIRIFLIYTFNGSILQAMLSTQYNFSVCIVALFQKESIWIAFSYLLQLILYKFSLDIFFCSLCVSVIKEQRLSPSLIFFRSDLNPGDTAYFLLQIVNAVTNLSPLRPAIIYSLLHFLPTIFLARANHELNYFGADRITLYSPEFH